MCGGIPFMIASVKKDSPEVVGDEPQRLPAGVGEPGTGQRIVEQAPDRGGADRTVLGADRTLEQDRQRWVEDPFVIVVGGHRRDRPGLVTDPADDGAEHVGRFRADHERPFGVGLGRAICSSDTSSPVSGTRYCTRLGWVNSVNSSTGTPGQAQCRPAHTPPATPCSHRSCVQNAIDTLTTEAGLAA
ncbi:MAG: hypothetical protein ACRDWT_12175 [Jatrophihabitantaceae bacterium]